MIKKLFVLLTKSTAAYIIGQILTGIEAGFLGAYLYVFGYMSFVEAVASSVTMLFPVMIIQTLIAFYVITKIQRRLGDKEKDAQS
jgi:membrane protein implicated in regulation of membrane protease activity